jgi:taurine--2-oxoglutarate transaminase
MIDLCKQHTLYTWSANDAVNPLPIARAEGVYLYTPEGQRILDFNSQLMSVLIGHGHPKVIAAMKRQLDELIFVYPQTATQVRARLGKLMAEITPGDINTLLLHARRRRGQRERRQGRASLHRSPEDHGQLPQLPRRHGNLTMGLTGDPRRWANEPAPAGHRALHGSDGPTTTRFGNDRRRASRRTT